LEKGFYEKSTIADKDNPINITYDELLHKSDSEVDSWIDELRTYVITQWDEFGQPPVIGQNEKDIISNWRKLFGYDVESFHDDKSNVIKNFNKHASGVNQFFPTMLKTKISTGVNSDNATSIYDHFKEDSLKDTFKKAMLRALYKDSMYTFSLSVVKSEMGMGVSEFLQNTNQNEKYGIMVVQQRSENPVDPLSEYLILKKSEVEMYLTTGRLTEQNLRTIGGELESSYELKNGELRYYHYYIRKYKRKQRIFPSALQVFRLGLGQPAVNFPPLTAKFLYEHFTKHIKNNKVNIYDPSSGWGGRILGAMCTDRDLHYIGTDPNPDNVGIYQRVAEFYNQKCFQTNPFWGKENGNTYEIFTDGSEEIGNNPNFQKYKGKLDMVFTSPPYFNREQYSQDENQSFKKFSAYEDWRDNFLRPTLTTAFEYLNEDRYLCWNIADIKVGDNKYIPLEQDSIDVVESLGGEYKGIYKMLMTRMVGIDASQIKNSVIVKKHPLSRGGDYYKFEPILIFYKPRTHDEI
tara:strand:- start:36 stop:1592 length:1557 start_codon:yes stop_codon:yes gene_type:complete